MRDLEKTLKALANRRRLAILSHLKKNGATAVGEIASEIRASFKATSKHLRLLVSADIVEGEQNGPEVHYKLTTNQKPAAGRIISLL